MTDLPILDELAWVVVAAAAALVVARSLRLPPLVAYMLAGLVLGPVTGLVAVGESVDRISEAGIALLLFLVGLELSFGRIRDIGRVAVLAGAGQIVLTTGGGFGLASLLGFELVPAAFLALATAFSSTVVVVKLLEQRGDTTSLHGRLAVGILLVQDVIVALVLTVLAGLEGSAGMDGAAVALGVARAFAGAVLLAVLAFLAARWVLPRLFAWLAHASEAVYVLGLAWCFLLVLVAHTVHLSVELGAFVAGVALAQLPHNQDLVRRVEPLVDFFLAVFFVSLGIRLDPAGAAQYAGAALAIALFVVAVKPAILMSLLPRLGQDEQTSFMTGLLLGQASEFSFIVASLGLAAGLIDHALLSLIGVVGLLTIGASAILIGSADDVFRRVSAAGLLRAFRAAPGTAVQVANGIGGHVIIVGMNTLGRRLVEPLSQRGLDVLAIDLDPAKLHGLQCRTMVGDAEHAAVLERAGLHRARLLISTLQIEDTNRLLAYRARRAGIPASIHAFDAALVRDLTAIGVSHLMVSKHDGIRQMAMALRQLGVID